MRANLTTGSVVGFAIAGIAYWIARKHHA